MKTIFDPRPLHLGRKRIKYATLRGFKSSMAAICARFVLGENGDNCARFVLGENGDNCARFLLGKNGDNCARFLLGENATILDLRSLVSQRQCSSFVFLLSKTWRIVHATRATS